MADLPYVQDDLQVQLVGVNPLTGTATNTANVDINGNLKTVASFQPGTQDVFGTLTVAPRQLQIDVQFFNGILSSLVQTSMSGTGSGAVSGGFAQFSTGTGTTAQATGNTSATTAYNSGCEVFAHFTAAFTTPTSSASYQKIGLYNSLNGFYVGYIGTSFGITIRNNGVDTTTVQTSWNVDTLTGTIGSLFTRNGSPEAINFTKFNIWRVRFGWLGSATIFYEVLSPDGIWVTFHKILQPNSSVTPSITNPNLPITVDVSKTSSDATNLIVSTACWGAGITFGTNVLEDPQTLAPLNITKRNEIRSTTSLMLVGGEQLGNTLDTNVWSTASVGSGSSVLSSAINQLSTGSTANSSITLNSLNRARFIPGTVNAFYAGVRLGDTGVANNTRRWGAYDSSDGVFFQLDGSGSTPGVGIRSSGSDTIVTTFNGPHNFTLDTNFHTYEIQYTSGSVYFYQDGNLIHSYTSATTALSSTPHYHLGFENTNSVGGTANVSLYVRGSAILRYGEANTRKRYFHPYYTSRIQTTSATTTGTNVASLTATFSKPIQTNSLIVVTAVRKSGTLTISDSASQSYLTATTQTSGTNTSYIFYKEGSTAGVTSVTITSTSTTDQMQLIATEYSSIVTSGSLDQTSINTNTVVTSWTSNSTASTTQANELLIGSCVGITHNNDIFTAGTNWTSVNTVNGSGGGNTLSAYQEDQYVVSTGTYAATGTTNQTDTLLAAIATFKISQPALSTGFTVINSPTTLKIGAGTLKTVIINTQGTGSASVTFYDNTTNSGNPIAIVSLTAATNELEYDLDFNNGLTMVVNSTTADFTVVYD